MNLNVQLAVLALNADALIVNIRKGNSKSHQMGNPTLLNRLHFTSLEWVPTTLGKLTSFPSLWWHLVRVFLANNY